jgi:CheY-like chemotaxis protein
MGVESQTIVVVGDDDAYRDVLEGALAHAGYRVLAAPDGNSGLLLLSGEFVPPALIVLDWTMPAWIGLDFLSSLEHDNRYAGVPVVVLAEVASAARIPGASVVAIVSKPVRKRTLIDVIGRLSGAPSLHDTTAPITSPRVAHDRTRPERARTPRRGQPTAIIRKSPPLLDGDRTGRFKR